jgi:hypothetical protein
MCRLTDELDPANDDVNCECRNAVERAYKTLVKTGHDSRMAMEAAKRVYRHYHPEDKREIRDTIVERWVANSIH